MKRKIAAVFVTILAFIIIFFGSWRLDFSEGEPLWGLTFSNLYAEEMRLDAREVFGAILRDLKPERVRIAGYWNCVHRNKGVMDFTDLDWQIREAERAGARITLAIGYRTPRWPECHAPSWAVELSKTDFEQALLTHLESVVDRYKSSPAIAVWQVENEPTLSSFGECPLFDLAFLKKEIALVKALDPGRPVVVTDSGELSTWYGTAGLSEILGTTLYRFVWSPRLGNFTHMWPPAWYTLRAALVKAFSLTDEVIVSELQAEPWAPGGGIASRLPWEEQNAFFNVTRLENNVEFARRTGLKEVYLWGVEWWYWRKINGDPTFWEFGKGLFSAGGIIKNT